MRSSTISSSDCLWRLQRSQRLYKTIRPLPGGGADGLCGPGKYIPLTAPGLPHSRQGLGGLAGQKGAAVAHLVLTMVALSWWKVVERRRPRPGWTWPDFGKTGPDYHLAYILYNVSDNLPGQAGVF